MAQLKSFRFPDELDKRIKARASNEDKSPSELVREALEMFLDFDADLLKSAQRLAGGLGLSPGQVIQNLAVRVFAENEAHRMVYGQPLPDLAHGLFVWEQEASRKHLITGDELYQHLKEKYCRRFKEEQATTERDEQQWKK